MLTTSLKLAEKYDYLNNKFKAAFQFLRTNDLSTLPLGRIEIKGDEIFLNVQEYDTMSSEECKFEAHDQYFDIQYVVSGKEQFGYVSRANLVIDTPYDEINDLIFYKEPQSYGSILLQEGDFAIVSPEDAHRPRCIDQESCKVRKIVVKVKL